MKMVTPRTPMGLHKRLLAALASMLALIGAPALAQDVSFAGKTVRIVTNTDAGSAVDIFVRQVAPYVSKHLAGKPTLIVENKPGGRFTLGAAYMAKNVDPDGMTMGVLATLIGQWAVGIKMPVDVFGYRVVGGQGVSTVVYARKDSELTSADDLKNPKKKIVMATAAPNTMPVLPIRLLMNAIGHKDTYQVISGYPGQMGIYQAVRTGESNMGFMFATIWFGRMPAIEKEGRLVALTEYGQLMPDGSLAKTPGLGLPTTDEVWRKLGPDTLQGKEYKAFQAILTTTPLEWLYVLPPNTPERFAMAWSKAIGASFKDPKFLAELHKSGAPTPLWLASDDATKLLARIKTSFSDSTVQAGLKSVFIQK